MHITDSIADMLTRIRNANAAKHDTVDVPASNMKKAIAKILLDEGYIKNFHIIQDGKQGIIRIQLKYGICRICFRELAYKGQIPGVRKASW